MTTQLNKATLTRAVDKLGELSAQIAELQRKAETMRSVLVMANVSEHEGKRYRAVICRRTTTRLSITKVRGFLSRQQLKACEKTGESVAVTLYDR